MMTRWMFALSILLLSDGVIPSAALGQVSTDNQSGRAKVECEASPVYSQMSKVSTVVGQLRKGDVVTIDMEFISADGAWCLIAGVRRMRLGYIQSECLDREQPRSFTQWQVQSPPVQTTTETEPTKRTEAETQKRPTKEEIEEEVDRVLASRLRGLPAANDPGQTVFREPFGFDQIVGFQSFCNPRCFEDRARFGFSPRLTAPFRFFGGIGPSITAHVQMRPSHISRRR